MKIWKILSPKVLTAEERPDNITTETQAKVKVTRLLFSDYEARAYVGVPRPKYPVVPGRFAVGVVAEAGKGCLKTEKNTRVYIHDVIPCGECARCRAGDAENCASMRAAGTACEGYLRDFVVTDESNLSPLPLSVSDDEALFIGIVSLCEAVIDRLRVGKGDHIAVFGGREMGNILCQLLIYHQAVPIFGTTARSPSRRSAASIIPCAQTRRWRRISAASPADASPKTASISAGATFPPPCPSPIRPRTGR